MAQAVAETLSQGAGTPLHHEAVGVQAMHDVANKSTDMTPYRKEEEKQYSIGDLLQQLETAENYRKHDARIKQIQRKFREEERARTSKASSSSGIGAVAKNLGGIFDSVASGLGYMFKPQEATPVKGVSQARVEGRTPPQGSSRSRDKSVPPSVRLNVESEPKSEISSIEKAKAKSVSVK